MQTTLKVYRFNPETDKEPHYDSFTIDAEPEDRVLDLLEKVRDDYDATQAFRRSFGSSRLSLRV
jgi:succinate dehydrogenase / fumarate reductase iron-sulfur subunit